MDTTYVSIMLVVFLVITGLAVDVGYLYVSEEDLQSCAENAAVAGAQAIKQRFLAQAQSDPGRFQSVLQDTEQRSARASAVEFASGKHKDAALVAPESDNSNALSADNDVTVGFWNVSSHSYTPGATPVNAVQVRTRRTAESSSVGMGSLGTFLAKITGTESFGSTPVAVAALTPAARAPIAICAPACASACAYPKVCAIEERRMSHTPPGPADPRDNRFLFTSLLHQVSITNTMSDMVCRDMPPQQVCGKPIYTTFGSDDALLRDIEAMMYNPNFDRSNKEFDRSGNTVGWWLITPIIDCSAARSDSVEMRTVTKYALVRISRICAGGPGGCGASAPFLKPASACGSKGEGSLYIDRISCVGCGSREAAQMPGLLPVLVK